MIISITVYRVRDTKNFVVYEEAEGYSVLNIRNKLYLPKDATNYPNTLSFTANVPDA